MDIFGATRSTVRSNYALITPDTHVVTALVGWERASAIIHITPELGARFTQYSAGLEAGGRSGMPGATVQRMLFVLHGEITIASPAGFKPRRILRESGAQLRRDVDDRRRTLPAN
jgi:(S)-ureidoglycine aminohydrolase